MHLPEFDACPMHSALRASVIGRINSVRVHWICLISLEKVNVHLLTCKQLLYGFAQYGNIKYYFLEIRNLSLIFVLFFLGFTKPMIMSNDTNILYY